MLQEVRFSFEHEGCPPSEASLAEPNATLLLSGLYATGRDIHANVLVYATTPQTIGKMEAHWRHNPRVVDVLPIKFAKETGRFHLTYRPKHSIVPTVMEHSPVSVGPVTIARGVEHFTIVGESKSLQKLMRELNKEGALQLTGLKEIHDPANAFGETAWYESVGDIGDKQLECLLLALREGYFDSPRKHSPSQIARKLGMSPSTFIRTLRPFEARILRSFVEEFDRTQHGRLEALERYIAASKSPRTND